MIGNHESFPVNMFPEATASNASKKFDPSWLYSAVARDFEHWLPGEEQQRTIKSMAYYQVRGVQRNVVIDN